MFRTIPANLEIILWSDKKGLGNSNKKIMINKPYLSSELRAEAYFSGSIADNTRLPSRGGMGIKLKMAKTTLICSPLIKPTTNQLGVENGKKRITNAKNEAISKLVIGPDRPIKPISLRGWRKL